MHWLPATAAVGADPQVIPHLRDHSAVGACVTLDLGVVSPADLEDVQAARQVNYWPLGTIDACGDQRLGARSQLDLPHWYHPGRWRVRGSNVHAYRLAARVSAELEELALVVLLHSGQEGEVVGEVHQSYSFPLLN